MTSKKQRPRSVYVERLGDTLHKTDFVHVKAAWGPDKGKLKVYRILYFEADEAKFAGQYWEQPRYKGSSLSEHDSPAWPSGPCHEKDLPEIVRTWETEILEMRLIDPLPVFVFHATALESIDATVAGQGASLLL